MRCYRDSCDNTTKNEHTLYCSKACCQTNQHKRRVFRFTKEEYEIRKRLYNKIIEINCRAANRLAAHDYDDYDEYQKDKIVEYTEYEKDLVQATPGKFKMWRKMNKNDLFNNNTR